MPNTSPDLCKTRLLIQSTLESSSIPIHPDRLPVLAIGKDTCHGQERDIFVARRKDGTFITVFTPSDEREFDFEDFLPGLYFLSFSHLGRGTIMTILDCNGITIRRRKRTNFQVFPEIDTADVPNRIKPGLAHSIVASELLGKEPFIVVRPKNSYRFLVVMIPFEAAMIMNSGRSDGGFADDPCKFELFTE
jgi:hypothetical protein